MTEPFERLVYLSIQRVDRTEVTATVERDALSSGVDLDELRPTNASIKVAAVVETELEVAPEDMLIEMESLVATSRSPGAPPSSTPVPTRGSSIPPPLPARASRSFVAPALPAYATAAMSPPPPVRSTLASMPFPLVLPVVLEAAPPPPPPPPPPFLPLESDFPVGLQQDAHFANTPIGFSDIPSTAPLALSVSFAPSAPSSQSGRHAPLRTKRVRLSPVVLAMLVVLVGTSVVAFGSVVALRYAHARRAEAAVPMEPPAHESVRETAAAAPPEAAAAPSSTVPTMTPAALPSVAVDSLPKAVTEPDMTLVTTPRSAKGHRVFVDGRVIGVGGTALQAKCGDHKVKVGSASKARLVHFPCGGAVTLD